MHIKSLKYVHVYAHEDVYRNNQVVILIWIFNKKESTPLWLKKKKYVLLHVRSPEGHFSKFGVQRFIIFQIGNKCNRSQRLQYPTYDYHKVEEKRWRYQYHGHKIHWKHRGFICPKTGYQWSGLCKWSISFENF